MKTPSPNPDSFKSILLTAQLAKKCGQSVHICTALGLILLNVETQDAPSGHHPPSKHFQTPCRVLLVEDALVFILLGTPLATAQIALLPRQISTGEIHQNISWAAPHVMAKPWNKSAMQIQAALDFKAARHVLKTHHLVMFRIAGP